MMETNFDNYPSKYAEIVKSGQQAESILYQEMQSKDFVYRWKYSLAKDW